MACAMEQTDGRQMGLVRTGESEAADAQLSSLPGRNAGLPALYMQRVKEDNSLSRRRCNNPTAATSSPMSLERFGFAHRI